MRTRFFLGLLLITTTIFLLTSPVMAVIIGFDDLPDQTSVSNQYLPLGVTFSSPTQNGGVRADKEAVISVSKPNVLFPTWASGVTVQSDLYIDFTLPVNNVSMWVLSVGDWSVVIQYFDSQNNSLGDVVIEHPGSLYGSDNKDLVFLPLENNIAHLIIRHGSDFVPGDGFAIDDLSFTPVTAVPEPSTMFLLGSGLIGLAGYGRKKFFKK